jgi:hypothetical protein
MTRFPYHIRIISGESGRSDWIRTSDPYPPRKRAIAKLLNYNAARCGTVLSAFLTCPTFPYPIRTAQEKPNE